MMWFSMAKQRKNDKAKTEKTEGIDECTRQIIAANMTMLVSISSTLCDIKQLELEHNRKLEELKATLIKTD